MSLIKQARKTRKKKNIPLFIDKFAKNKAEAFALLLVVSIIIILISLLSFQPDYTSVQDGGKKTTENMPQQVRDCISQNPTLLEEQCWDMYYQDRAVTEDDETMCARIMDAEVRAHCERYF